MSARDSEAGNPRGEFRNTWYFTFDLQASHAGVESQLEAFESSPFRRNRLKTASIISFEQVQVYLPACSCGTPAPKKWQQGDSDYWLKLCRL